MARVIAPPRPEQRCVELVLDGDPAYVEAYVTETVGDVVAVVLIHRGRSLDAEIEVATPGGIYLPLDLPVQALVDHWGFKLLAKTKNAEG